MLTSFDWIRQCRSGAELLATLALLETNSLHLPYPSSPDYKSLGPPLTLCERPCRRCWIYAPVKLEPPWLCQTCLQVVTESGERHWRRASTQSVVIWGTVNRLPKIIGTGQPSGVVVLGCHVYDSNHFLLILYRKDLLTWLKELAIYDSDRLAGLLQIFPPAPDRHEAGFASLFSLAVALNDPHQMDQLRIHLHPRPYYLLQSKMRKQLDSRNLSLTESIQLLEMVKAIRRIFGPREQEQLLELARMNVGQERQFYWGRFVGNISPEARNFLEIWQLRHWSLERFKLLYDLKPYMVDFTS